MLAALLNRFKKKLLCHNWVKRYNGLERQCSVCKLKEKRYYDAELMRFYWKEK